MTMPDLLNDVIDAPLRNLYWWEARQLRKQGCNARNWDDVFITDRTDLSKIWNSFFSGNVSIGALFESDEQMNGIFNSVIEDSVVGDGSFLRNIGVRIKNCIIGKNVAIENTAEIVFDPEAQCGVGIPVSVLDETGTRPVYIYPGLSAQTAALAALKPKWAANHLHELIETHIENAYLPSGIIGDNVRISNCGLIRNVRIYDNVIIESALRLVNGTIVNNAQRRPMAYIGAGVDAESFIIEDARVSGGTLLRNVYAGQGVILDKGFTAHDSLFFANSNCENGEACALFAGPYTVSMHKSTLLIGAMTSFMNAGSATNQSNHMYKLGPAHWGIMDRGVKTSSNSYIMWGGRIGPFSLLMGQHKHHPDTSDFPFSYLFGNENGETEIAPALMLKSCGLLRDEKKWPGRDRRLKRKMKFIDRLNFSILNPMTIEKIMRAIKLCDEFLMRASSATDKFIKHSHARIKFSNLQRARNLYNLAVCKYVFEKISDSSVSPLKDFHTDSWIDLAGQILPMSLLPKILDSGSISEMEAIFTAAHEKFSQMERSWIEQNLADYISLGDELKRNAEKFDLLCEEDRRKYLDLLSEENNLLKI